MRISICLIISLLLVCTVGHSQRNSDIKINKKPRTTTNTNTNKYPSPTKSSPSTSQNTQKRVEHENVKTLENLELRYTAAQIGSTTKHNHYRIVGHIYSNLNEPIFCHNRRIVMFQIDNWDAGFLNDNLQSVDGYPTQHKLKPQGVLYQFGNSTVREFSFDFKVKKGLQPRIRSEIIKDWQPLELYEQYLLLEYTMLNGEWHMEGNAEANFQLSFAPQGNALQMKDIFGTPTTWTKDEGNMYVRKIGNAPAATTANNQQQQSQSSQNSNNSSNYPAGGYLGNGNNNQNNNTQNQNNNNSQNNSSNYPSGGYLGGGSNSNSNQSNNATNQNVAGSYSSVIEIVDRNTIRYRNSEGIVCMLKKTVQ